MGRVTDRPFCAIRISCPSGVTSRALVNPSIYLTDCCEKSKVGEVFSLRVCYVEIADARVGAPVLEAFDQCWEGDLRDVRVGTSSQKHEEEQLEHYR